MAAYELSFTFDDDDNEIDYDNDYFDGDMHDFEMMWQDIGEEIHEKEENERFQKMFHQQLFISEGFERSTFERYI